MSMGSVEMLVERCTGRIRNGDVFGRSSVTLFFVFLFLFFFLPPFLFFFFFFLFLLASTIPVFVYEEKNSISNDSFNASF